LMQRIAKLPTVADLWRATVLIGNDFLWIG
jgi:hypothetical protein